MTLPEPRSGPQRKADTLAKLEASGADVWVASASVAVGGAPEPYLVPLSLAWIDGRVVRFWCCARSGSRPGARPTS